MEGHGKSLPQITVVSGFLGSGKTTLIKRMFREGCLGESPLLLENDFGSMGIDGALVESSGLRVSELLSGCICCSLKTEFPQEVDKLLQAGDCDHLVIEPSGVGKLSDILKGLSRVETPWRPGLSVCIVDVRLFDSYQKTFPFIYWDQILSSDVVLFNFAREAKGSEVKDAMEAIYERDPGKIIICNDRFTNTISLLEEVPRFAQAKALEESRAFKGLSAQSEGHCHHKDHKPVFDSYAKVLTGAWSKEKMQVLLGSLPDSAHYGTVLRAKAIATCGDDVISGNYIPGRVRIDTLSKSEADEIRDDLESRVIVIGRGIKHDALDRLFSH